MSSPAGLGFPGRENGDARRRISEMAAAVEEGQATIQALQELLNRSKEALGDQIEVEDER